MRARFAYLPSILLVAVGTLLLAESYADSRRPCYGPCDVVLYPSPLGLTLLILGLSMALLFFFVRWRPAWWKRRLGID